MKKTSKKTLLAGILCVIVTIFIVSYFVININYDKYSPDDIIVTGAKNYTEKFTQYTTKSTSKPYSRHFNVSKSTNSKILMERFRVEKFYINSDGKQTQIIASNPVFENSTPTVIFNKSKADKKIVKISKRRIFKYIDESNILRDKEKIKKFIDNLPVRDAIFLSYENNDTFALFSPENETIYINKKCKYRLSERAIVREYISAISYYSHNFEKGTYWHTKFNKLFTDLICVSICRDTLGNKPSSYNDFTLIFPYINLFGSDSIQAYFYGYENIYKTIPQDEFEFWIMVVEYYNTLKNSEKFYDNLILKWYSK